MEPDHLAQSQPTVLERVVAFVDERVGLKTLQAKMLNEPVPGGSRWAYIFGSCLLFIFVLQAVTGVLLMFYYVPSVDHAYASTQYIIHEVDYGWFILSYHFWGSSVMVVMVFAHMSQVFLWGAYKSPRELIWLVGLVLFGIVMAFGFTGYLLPWDQRSYWATIVGVEIMDKTPLIGDFLARFLKGGPTAGQMTLNRFFLIHVMVLPAALMALAGLHIFLFRKNRFRGIVMAFGFTGYLLPWDQRSYWATIVGVEIMDKTPLIGDFLARFLKGGPTAGQMTLNRFFLIHVMVLPAALMALAGLHIFLFRKAGPAGPFHGGVEELKAKTDYFFPRQVWKDIVAVSVVFVSICGLAFIEPVVLLEEATPDPGDYHPEPEWYFLFMFQLLRLKIFGGELGQFLGAVAIPGAFMLLLAALPFIDRSPERNIFKRPIALVSYVVVVLGIVLFTVSAVINREFLD